MLACPFGRIGSLTSIGLAKDKHSSCGQFDSDDNSDDKDLKI